MAPACCRAIKNLLDVNLQLSDGRCFTRLRKTIPDGLCDREFRRARRLSQ
jgi:hypothetical protein